MWETVETLRARLESAWYRATSAAPDEWSEENPALGQCVATALIVQDALGGEIVRATTHERVGAPVVGDHYWNRLAHGVEVDLTRSQFAPTVVFGPAEPQDRHELMAHAGTRLRYMLLSRRVAAA